MASLKDNKRLERRYINLTDCEVRAADGEGPAMFTGYAAVFNELSVNLGGFRERIQPGCFRNAVEQNQDVRFLINHDANLLLGRSTSGTLKLFEDEIGLRVECALGNQTYARDLSESMERGDIDQMSFGFTTVADDWVEKDKETGLPIRELIEANLFDVSVVAYPAYPDTSAEIRSMIAEQTPELLERAQRAAEELGDPDPEDEETPEETADADEEREEETPEETADAEVDEEQLRAAGVRIEEDHPQCDGVAVVWNFNDEMQSCHTTREAAEAQVEALMSGAAGAARDSEVAEDETSEEREGKTLSKANAEKLSGAVDAIKEVLDAAGVGQEQTDAIVELIELKAAEPEGETRDDETLPPNLAQFRAQLEERGWDYDDDWKVWSLTQMIEAASCLLLFAQTDPRDDDAAEDAAEDAALYAAMSSIMSQLGDLLAQVTGAAGSERDDDAETEQRSDRFARERRRLALLEREIDLV